MKFGPIITCVRNKAFCTRSKRLEVDKFEWDLPSFEVLQLRGFSILKTNFNLNSGNSNLTTLISSCFYSRIVEIVFRFRRIDFAFSVVAMIPILRILIKVKESSKGINLFGNLSRGIS